MKKRTFRTVNGRTVTKFAHVSAALQYFESVPGCRVEMQCGKKWVPVPLDCPFAVVA